MEKKEEYKRLIMFTASLVIIAAQTAVFAYLWYSYYRFPEVIKIEYWRRGNWTVVAIYALMVFVFSKAFGAFKVGYLRVLDVLFSQFLSVICVNIITYLQLALIGRWKFMSYSLPIIKMTGIDLILVFTWVLFMRWIYAKIYPPRQMLLIYGEYSPDALIDKISSRKDKYNICETIHIEEGMDALKKKMGSYKAVVIGDIPSGIRNQLLKYCFARSIRCYSIPKISDIMLRSAEDIHLFDTPLLLSRNRGMTAEQKFAKRMMDIIVSVMGVLIASPFMIIISLCINLYDGGPVFYRQERLTIHGKPFSVYKFRSMRVDSEKNGARLAMKDDDRITPVGRILRNIHFDELPQLFNILKGDMSLVGPRPERPGIFKEYEKEIPEFPFRLKVKAGLTGYAQVYGKYNTTPYDKLKLDLTYIENYSLWLDFKIMFATVKILFQKENTEGVESWQVTAATKEKHEIEK